MAKKQAYDHRKIEKKWQKKWETSKIYKTDDKTLKLGQKKFYVLDMFPYPSGEGLHVGHPKGYIATDVVSRMKRMSGYKVLHPMGWDAFGLPAEQFAIKNKTNPMIGVKKTVARFKKQVSIIGLDYDWDREINTTDPKYYKWTQWTFLKMLEAGLAYESHEPINWCPSCKTGLANEDVEDGKCERCGTPVEKKPLRQWVIRITKYADRLLNDLEALEWPEPIKDAQRNWIGRSKGINFTQKVKDLDIKFEVYDSIPQTYIAQTFTVIAPEHPMVIELVKGTIHEEKVMEFVKKIKEKKQANRFDIEKDSEGIFTGRYVDNPFGTGDLPIWIASYVLADYGTGIVNCSAHDERDFAFAKKYDIPLKVALLPEDEELAEKVKKLEVFYREPNGIIQAPEGCKGLRWDEGRGKVIEYIVKNKIGKETVNYKLRDWVFSRQRYWGEPIPVIHCADCGVVPVPYKDLPVVLPKVKSYEPTGTGESPLANILSWVNVKCPKCKGPGKRETNTMPQWAGSSWYYLRYMDPKNDKALVDPKKEAFWSPVDFYVGGAEHAARHLIYARFWHKFLQDIGVVKYGEPFKKLQNVGLIMGEDGRKMSKRYGNVVNPDTIVETYGADTLRLYEMFMGPFDQEITWKTDNIIGVRRFLEKIWRLQERVVPDAKKNAGKKSNGTSGGTSAGLDNPTEILFNQTIKKVTDDINTLGFNTAISQMMILVNQLEKLETIPKSVYLTLIKLLAPFAPHATEEIWMLFGEKGSVHTSGWPEYDSSKLVLNTITVMVQVNGKVRDQFSAELGITKEEMEKLALDSKYVKDNFAGKTPSRIIVVPNKIVNLVY